MDNSPETQGQAGKERAGHPGPVQIANGYLLITTAMGLASHGAITRR
jgi:hypothetical protein